MSTFTSIGAISERIHHGVDEALPQAAVVVKNQEEEDDV